ncbi:MAG: ABC transporter ATP-binding protein/permease [Candidatus Bathyarchaeota archaeon]|nr:ABC transporter ATP-binding protein/permease [Candidatus Bathyarchaeota archaeon]
MTGYHWGRVLGREEEEYERKIPDRVLIKRLMEYVLKSKRKLVIAIVAVLLASLTGLVPPYLLKVAIDNYISVGNLTGLTFISLILIGVYLAYWLSDYQRTYQISWLGQNMVNEIRKQLFSHLQDLSFSFYDQSEAGRIISRVTNDTDTLSQIFVQGVVMVISDILTLVGIVTLMLLMNVHLTLVTLLVVPLLLTSTFAFQSRLRRAFRATRKKIAQVTSRLQESISGIREIQSFTRERDTIEVFRQANIENLQANVQAGKLFALLLPIIQIIGAVGTCIVLWYSGILTLGGGVTLGVVVAFLLLVTRFFRPIVDLTTFYNTIQSAMAAAERIFETLDTKPEIADASDALELPTVKGEILFENITFGYDSSYPVLRDINVRIEHGKTLAIVGPTGAGKSTFVKLLSRFYEPQSGTIKVDGYNISKLTQESLRRQMGVVLQEPFLFSGTVMENIRYGKLDATEEEVENVAKMVGAYKFILQLSKGYKTDVGERGTRLSLGQRQLVSFARALLRNPPILILDEATSSVDPYTELIIKRGLAVLLKNRTSLVIAHRLSTVRNADNIIVLNNGRIVEEGNHGELMKKKGLYRRLYEKQFKDI